MSAPTPEKGLAVFDPDFPDETWVIVQADHGHIFLRRESDGYLCFHDLRSWAWAWEHDTLRAASSRGVEA